MILNFYADRSSAKMKKRKGMGNPIPFRRKTMRSRQGYCTRHSTTIRSGVVWAGMLMVDQL